MKSFVCAWRGIVHAVQTERNVRIHLAALFYVVVAGRLLYSVRWEWLMLACGLVIGAELINTALERLCDGLEPGRSEVVRNVKDLAAGAVLVCAAAAAAGAVFVFWWDIEWYLQIDFYPALLSRPLFWAGVAALPLWSVFIFWFGRKKKGE
ncbi:MAG: diacylglycerol kinase [Oscillospiraceae bacterium]|nr:diacylglycerol kinase [Oscillospiraceae bacterium]